MVRRLNVAGFRRRFQVAVSDGGFRWRFHLPESMPPSRHGLARRTWSTERADDLATFPLPSPTPSIIVGVNSVPLARLAGRLADGINVQWGKPHRHECLAAADAEAGDRTFVRTAYHVYDEALLDPDHVTRREMAEQRIDRLVLAHFGPTLTMPESV